MKIETFNIIMSIIFLLVVLIVLSLIPLINEKYTHNITKQEHKINKSLICQKIDEPILLTDSEKDLIIKINPDYIILICG